MTIYYKCAATLAAAGALVLAAPAAHAETAAGEAVKLRQLDIMLMVSSLRCRFGADDFQADYERFADNHSAQMGAEFRTLQDDYAARLGAPGAKKALDRISVGMANQYGQGHPWLGCGELKAMTQHLAGTNDRSLLLTVADDVLGEAPRPTELAYNE